MSVNQIAQALRPLECLSKRLSIASCSCALEVISTTFLATVSLKNSHFWTTFYTMDVCECFELLILAFRSPKTYKNWFFSKRKIICSVEIELTIRLRTKTEFFTPKYKNNNPYFVTSCHGFKGFITFIRYKRKRRSKK